jgi:glucose-1-phosphate adenylyltransferase
MQVRVLSFVLAGGKGTRLYPLTKERAKPAVPFGGRYRIVDFVLSNLLNSGLFSIYVLIQFKSQSLLQHLRDGWDFGGMMKDNFIIPVPAQMRSDGEDWYRGTADAIYQNMNLIEQAHPHLVVIFGADHIYRMNIREMIEYHAEHRAKVTIAAIPVTKEEATDFGVIEVDTSNRIIGFHEKSKNPPEMPGRPGYCLASMGNYIFSTDLLVEVLDKDGRNPASAHDFGRDILPSLVGVEPMYVYDFQTNRIPGDPLTQEAYWRDVGTIDAYYEASMDLRAVHPALNLYNRQWPLRTAGYSDAPAKFTFDEDGKRGEAIDSIVSGGSILAGGKVTNSVLGRGVRVLEGAVVEDSVVFDNCVIGPHAHVQKAILDKNVEIAAYDKVGLALDPNIGKRPGFLVSESGIVIVEGRRSRVDIASMQI